MAAGIIVFPGFMPVVDGDAARVSGAKAYFYLNLTGTLTTVYTDNTLATAHPNPVEADSLGVWPAMWAATTDLFTVSLTDGDGVPLSGGSWSGLGPATDATTASVALSASYAIEAAASAASALGAPGTSATSSTNLAIGLGARTFVLNEDDKAFSQGQRFVASSDANALNQMSGIATDWVPGTNSLTLEIDKISGAGAHVDWNIALTGDGAVSSVAGLAGAILAATLKAALAITTADITGYVDPSGRHAVWIPAAAMTARTTNGAAAGLTETTTNKVMRRTYDFDASTLEYVQFAIRMPKSWNEGTVTFVPEWSHAATTVNFKASWGLQGVALSDDDAGDAAFGVAQFSNDTGGTTDDLYAGPESAAITIAGAPANEDLVIFQVQRMASDAVNDTLAIDARLHGVTVYITTTTGNDA